MKHSVEIDDTLDERVEGAIDDVKSLLEDYLRDNPEVDELPDLGNDLDYSGSVHEIVDGSVSVYTKEIKDIWYLHEHELVEAYENAGIGNDSHENDGMTAIYCLIDQKVRNWYCDSGKDVVEEFIRKRELAEGEK